MVAELPSEASGLACAFDALGSDVIFRSVTPYMNRNQPFAAGKPFE